jgi:hypothetical protein
MITRLLEDRIEHKSRRPELSGNGGDYETGAVVAYDETGTVVGGYYYASHDWGVCPGCGNPGWNNNHYHDENCTAFEMPTFDAEEIRLIEATESRLSRILPLEQK